MHQRHGGRYVFATCVTLRDTDATQVTFPITRKMQLSRLTRSTRTMPGAAAPRPGGLGPNLRIPLLADRNIRVAHEYGCLIEDKGITFRASYLIHPKGVLRQITMNDLPVRCSVNEAWCLVQAFQLSVSDLSHFICGGVALTQGG